MPARALPALDPQLHQRLRAGLARLDQAEPPDWGLGRPGAEGTGVLPFELLEDRARLGCGLRRFGDLRHGTWLL